MRHWIGVIGLAALLAACTPAALTPATTPSPTSEATALPSPTPSPTPEATALPSPTPSPTPTPEAPSPSQFLTIARAFDPWSAMGHIEELASATYQGRRAGTDGERQAAQYLAGRMRALGLDPVGEGGSYFQPFDIDLLDLAAQPVLEILDAQGSVQSFVLRVDFREWVFGPAGPGEAQGELVYAARGTPSDLAGLPVEGNIVLVSAQQGPVEIPDVAARVLARGGEGLLVLTEHPAAFRVKRDYPRTFPPTIPVFLVGEAVVSAMAQAGGFPRAQLGSEPFSTGVQGHMELEFTPAVRAPTKNVLGLWPGTDPELGHLVIVVGGHYDHMGRDPDGTLFAGANDNASGVSVGLAVAQHLIGVRFQPQVSLLFVGWGAEELGFLGSRYYLQNPVFPLEATIAVLNLDVVGQGTEAHLLITQTTGPQEEVLARLAEDLGVAASTIPDPGNSDQAPFNRAGIPASRITWRGGDALIHRTTDTYENIDPEKIRAAGQLVTLAVMHLATDPAFLRDTAYLDHHPSAAIPLLDLATA